MSYSAPVAAPVRAKAGDDRAGAGVTPLRLRVVLDQGPPVDIELDGTEDATVGAVANAAGRLLGIDSPVALVLETVERRTALRPATPLRESGLCSGELVRLGTESGDGLSPDLSSPPAPALLRVLNGPAQGTTFALATGANVIGRDRPDTINLPDSSVSRQHALVSVEAEIELIDLGSTNGTEIAGVPLKGAGRLVSGERFIVGDTELELVVTRPSIGDSAADDAHVVTPPPWIFPPHEERHFRVPALPGPPPTPRFPIASIVLPVLMAGVLYAVTRDVRTLLFLALTPLLFIGSAIENRRFSKRDHRRAVREFRADFDDLVAELRAAQSEEARLRDIEHPSADAAGSSVETGAHDRWQRAWADPRFMQLRLGRGRLPSRNSLDVPHGGFRELRREVAAVAADHAELPDLPVLWSADEGGLGIVANGRAAGLALCRSLVVQAAAFHSPADLVLSAALFDVGGWDFLKWLPHVNSEHWPLPTDQIAIGSDAAEVLVDGLLELVQVRMSGGDTQGGPSPRVLVVFDEPVPVDRRTLQPLLDHGSRVGIALMWRADRFGSVPGPCGTVLTIGSAGGGCRVGYRGSGRTLSDVLVESLAAPRADDIARKLSSLRDGTRQPPAASRLPRLATLPSVFGEPRILDDPELIADRWDESAARTEGLRAVIGQGLVAPVAVDLRVDGPHALVAGTTGAGKSELLQTMIVSLAATHGPERINFILVDYKGGAAFKDCQRLPHTVGFVTDLDQHEVTRALVSLNAEVRRREQVLRHYGAKDIVELERHHPDAAPPNLLIVVDEFAALVKEIPEFIEGMVNIAQRGRSLGIHLLLATQRPGGVVTDHLRANTNLRIALRVAGEAESIDVLGIDAAARLDRQSPGRAVAKVGPNEYMEFQTIYLGGVGNQEGTRSTGCVRPFSLGVKRTAPERATGRAAGPSDRPTDLKRIVDTVVRGAQSRGTELRRRPWLDPLPEVLDLTDLIVPGSREGARRSRTESKRKRVRTELLIGRGDRPSEQAQFPVAFVPDVDGNMLIFGSGRSGKSVALRTLVASAGMAWDEDRPFHVYGLDFGGGGLVPLGALPHVGAVIPGHDCERVGRLLRWLRTTIDRRGTHMAASGVASFDNDQRFPDERSEPRLMVVLDDLSGFTSAFEKIDRGELVDLLPRLVADGPRAGVHFVITASRRADVPSSIYGIITTRLVLALATADEYLNLGMRASVPDCRIAGRGHLRDVEMQTALLGGRTSGEEQAAAIQALARSMGKVPSAPPIERMPDTVLLDRIQTRYRDPLQVAVGVSGVTLEAVSITLAHQHFMVAGPPRSGRTTTLQTIGSSLVANGVATSVIAAAGADVRLLAGHEVAVGPEEALKHLARIRAIGTDGNGGPHVLLVEGLPDLLERELESALLDLLRVGRGRPIRLVATGEVFGFKRNMSPVISELKAAKHGLLLQPDGESDGDIFSTILPRGTRLPLLPGRAYLVSRGLAEPVQLAYSPQGAPDAVSPVLPTPPRPD